MFKAHTSRYFSQAVSLTHRVQVVSTAWSPAQQPAGLRLAPDRGPASHERGLGVRLLHCLERRQCLLIHGKDRFSGGGPCFLLGRS